MDPRTEVEPPQTGRFPRLNIGGLSLEQAAERLGLFPGELLEYLLRRERAFRAARKAPGLTKGFEGSDT